MYSPLFKFIPLLTLISTSTCLDFDESLQLEERANSQSFPISISFGVKIPTVSSASRAPSLSIAGYHFPLPATTLSGNLVSFLGNIAQNQTFASQLTSINPSAPQSVQTSSSSTSVSGGNSSYTNASVSAGQARIITMTFSSGNSSSAAGGAQGNTTSTSTSSSGASNSTATAVANAAGDVTILTNATVANASNAQSILNQNAAEAATSCAADSATSHATSTADEITTVYIPIGSPNQNTSIISTAYAACSAGVLAPSQPSGSGSSSSSGSQASLVNVASMVTCNGITSQNQISYTTFKISIVGKWTKGIGFEGAVTGQRVAVSSSSC